ncbi:hypothetical protein B0T17DRAFT_512823 [Bombardia bombarda]|uniref:Uncharacterized protein n=1 Tax=Bombardia bombarda TaxID=252184 RepID=A0AA40CDB5_9PEZI|nr:hypothetical protein B0T17DRAFT_512823 [Bombardia bombarda]
MSRISSYLAVAKVFFSMTRYSKQKKSYVPTSQNLCLSHRSRYTACMPCHLLKSQSSGILQAHVQKGCFHSSLLPRSRI